MTIHILFVTKLFKGTILSVLPRNIPFTYLFEERTWFLNVDNGNYWLILFEFYFIFWILIVLSNFIAVSNFFLLGFILSSVKFNDIWREFIDIDPRYTLDSFSLGLYGIVFIVARGFKILILCFETTLISSSENPLKT